MTDKTRFWSSLPLLVFASLALAGLAYLGSHTRYIADDYCSDYYARGLGLLNSIMYWYVNWTGRYSAAAFDWLVFAKVFGPHGAHLVPPITIAIWLATTIATVHVSLKAIAPRASVMAAAIAIGVSLVLAVMVLSPQIPQSYFWLNGIRLYSLPLVVMTLMVFLFRWTLPRLKPTWSLWLVATAAFGLTFVNGGFNEILAVLQLLLLSYMAGVHWLSHGRRVDVALRILAAAILGAVASVVVVALAPGNAVRMAGLPPSPSVARWVALTIRSHLHFFHHVFLSPLRLTALLGALSVSAWVGTRHGGQISSRWRTIVVPFLAGLLLPIICIIPAVYGYDSQPPARSLSIAAFAVVTCWMYTSFHIGRWIARSGRSPRRLEVGLIATANLLIGIAAVLSLRYVDQNRGAYMAFARKWDAMDAQVRQARARHEPFAEIPAMSNWAALQCPNDDPKFWLTDCYSEYYGIQVYGSRP